MVLIPHGVGEGQWSSVRGTPVYLKYSSFSCLKRTQVIIDNGVESAFLNTDGNCQSVARVEVTPEPDANGNRQSFDLSLFQTPIPGVPVFEWTTDSESVITETQPIQLKSEFKINAWNNHSPSCMVPPVWNILASCEQQYLDLAPYDLDGDIVRCRWADLSEVGLAQYRPGNISSGPKWTVYKN